MKFQYLQFVSATLALAIGLSSCSSSSDNSNSSDNGNGNNADILHDEAVDGDITDDPNNPLPLQLAGVDNTISGSVVSPDRDYITVNVPAGSQLSGIVLDEYTSTGVQSFIGVQAGSVFTEPPTDTVVENLLGFALFGSTMTGTNILPIIATGEGAQGFEGALPAGDYTFWIQETSDNNVDYTFTMQLTPEGEDTSELTVQALFDEADGGEISDDPFNPLPLQLTASDNRFRASVIVGDLDYVTVNVPAGQVLSSITLEDYVSSNSTSFIGIQAGTVFTEPATDTTVGNLLGYAHFGSSMIGTNILPAVSTGAGALGFSPPLAAGDYTFWMQETSDAPVNFSLNFGLTAAP